jgi:hypothetical protein
VDTVSSRQRRLRSAHQVTSTQAKGTQREWAFIHTRHITHVVPHVVGDHGGVVRVVLVDPRLHLRKAAVENQAPVGSSVYSFEPRLYSFLWVRKTVPVHS